MDSAPRDGRWLILDCGNTLVGRFKNGRWETGVEGCAELHPVRWWAMPK